jgi:MFS family permease
LALLRDPRYRNYWIALFISQLGTWMQAAAQGWLVLELTGSAERLGLVMVCQFLPSLLLSLPAGVLADRYPRRNLLLLTQSAMAILAGLMALLILTDWIRYEYVLLFAFLYGAFNAIDLPVRQAFTVELAGRERYPGAIALNSFGFNVSRVTGPAVAGLLIAELGLGWAYVLNALSFVIMLLLLLRTASQLTEPANGSALQQALEGLRYVWHEPLVRQVVLMVGLASLFGMNFQTLVPAYSRLVLGLDAQGYGFLMSAVGVGAVAAAVLQALTARARPIRTLVGSGVLAFSLALLFLPLPPWGVAVALAICGFGMITTLVNANTTVQLRVPDRLRGRVMSVYSMVLLGVAPVGGYLTGSLMDTLGGRTASLVLAGFLLLSALWLSRHPWPRTVEDPPRPLSG